MIETWALVPLKDFTQAKRRLAAQMDAPRRAQLAERMASHVLDVLQDHPGLARVAVISADAAVRRWARERGAIALSEPGRGLNDALSLGAQALAGRGAQALLVVPGDLPLLSADDVGALLAEAAPGTAIVVPAARDGGTNALLVAPPTLLTFCFGPDSATRHLAQSDAGAVRTRSISLRGFERDLDTPDDLDLLAALEARAMTEPVTTP